MNAATHSSTMLPLENHPGTEIICRSEQEAPANPNLFTGEYLPARDRIGDNSPAQDNAGILLDTGASSLIRSHDQANPP
jgi:hypothetical protein